MYLTLSTMFITFPYTEYLASLVLALSSLSKYSKTVNPTSPQGTSRIQPQRPHHTFLYLTSPHFIPTLSSYLVPPLHFRDFPIQLENPHVIDKHQMVVGVITKGPDGTVLNSSYQTRFNRDYVLSLGNAIGEKITETFLIHLWHKNEEDK